jgi:hypothetical protein
MLCCNYLHFLALEDKGMDILRMNKGPMTIEQNHSQAISKTIAILILIVIIAIASVATYAVVLPVFYSGHVRGSMCIQSASSSFYLTVKNDSTNSPFQGVTVSGVVKWLCGSSSSTYYVATQSISSLHTPSNGTVLVGSIIGNYSLTLLYNGMTNTIEFSGGVEQNVNVTVLLPSNHVTVIGCVFGNGSCFNETNPNDETMITTSTCGAFGCDMSTITATSGQTP